MSDIPTYYSKKVWELQEKQMSIYKDWIESQNQIFERYMKEFQNIMKSLRKLKTVKKLRRQKAKRKRTRSKSKRRR